MKYDVEDKKSGVALKRDAFAEQFADTGDIHINYWVEVHGSFIAESEDRIHLANELEIIIAGLTKVTKFLKKKK